MDFTEKEQAVYNDLQALIEKGLAGTVRQDVLEAKLKELEGKLPTDKLADILVAVERQGTELAALKERGTTQYKTMQQQLAEQMHGKTKSDLRGGIDLTIDLNLIPSYKQVDTIAVGSQNYLPFPTFDPGWSSSPLNQPILRQISDVGTTPTGRVVYVRLGAREGTVNGTSEGAVKDQIDFTPTAVGVTAAKMAAFIKFTEEAMDDIPSFMAELEKEIMAQINTVEDSTMLTYLTGTVANAFTLSTLTTLNPTNYDAILAAATQVRGYNFNANAALLNPVDYAAMLMSKADSGGSYMLPPFASQNLLTIGGVTLYPSNQITVGNVLVGDFSKFHIRDYKGLTLRLGYDGNDFTYNLMTAVAERRTAYYVKGATTVEEWNAFVYDKLSDIITAITGS